MGQYSIKDLEHLSGIKAHTIRIWEQRYDLFNPSRTETNIRTYSDYDLKLLLNIALLNNNGYKISRISVMKITDSVMKYPEQIQALTLALVDMDQQRFDRVLSSNILKMGFERTMIHVIYPFLSRTGLLWQTGTIIPAQEHFMSNLVRQKLITAIDGQYTTQRLDTRTFLLFLPEGELHELSLLFADYILKSRGNRTIYLGQSVPFEDMRSVYPLIKPDYLLTVITSSSGLPDTQEYLNLLGETFADSTIIISGLKVVGQDMNIPKNMILFTRIEEIIEFASIRSEAEV